MDWQSWLILGVIITIAVPIGLLLASIVLSICNGIMKWGQ